MLELVALFMDKDSKNYIKYIIEINKLNFLLTGSDWRIGKYGVDQGILEDLLKNPTSYKEFRDLLKSKYNFVDDFEADMTMKILNSIGACEYATFANIIVANYKDNPEQFQKDFGFPLYVQDSNRKLVINDAELLADIYIFCNSVENGGKVFYTDSNGTLNIRRSNLETDPHLVKTVIDNHAYYSKYTNKLIDQDYPAMYADWNDEIINEYIHSKVNYIDFKQTGAIGSESYFKSGLINESQVVNSPLEIRSEIQQAFARGDDVGLDIKNKKNITLHSTDSNVPDSTFDGGHAMFVTRADDDKVVVSSWGREYFITYEDLLNSQQFSFRFSQLEDNNVIVRSNDDVDIINKKNEKVLPID